MQTTTHQPQGYWSHPEAPVESLAQAQVVVVTQPAAIKVHPGTQSWSTGICGCTEDCCLCTYVIQ